MRTPTGRLRPSEQRRVRRRLPGHPHRVRQHLDGARSLRRVGRGDRGLRTRPGPVRAGRVLHGAVQCRAAGREHGGGQRPSLRRRRRGRCVPGRRAGAARRRPRRPQPSAADPRSGRDPAGGGDGGVGVPGRRRAPDSRARDRSRRDGSGSRRGADRPRAVPRGRRQLRPPSPLRAALRGGRSMGARRRLRQGRQRRRRSTRAPSPMRSEPPAPTSTCRGCSSIDPISA